MKYLLFILVLLITVEFSVAQSYILDNESSSAEWVGYGEIGSFKQEGNIDLKTGEIYLEDSTVKSGVIILDANSIKHEDKKLNKHLKAKDFFHVKRYPEIKFEVSSTKNDEAYGTLTIKGVSHEETFTFSKFEKNGLLIIEGIANIDRTKYNIKYNSSSYFQDLGNYAIKNVVDFKFKLVFKKSD